jgi:hypothetical protein
MVQTIQDSPTLSLLKYFPALHKNNKDLLELCFQDQHFDMFKNFYIPVYGIVICHVLVMRTLTIYFEE